ncbi:MAG TPA: precorrin-3B C(17)-methyltransferase [Anaeromyxobacter sp.]
MTGRGKLAVVGLGPGAPDQLTPAARAAIAGADVVVGYRPYVALVAPLLAGKELVEGLMTGETERAREAIARARAGARVALVSSGDAGVYGMASLVLEILRDEGWTRGGAPDLEILPGVTALASCAALAGAPLGHDFCAISLSDLLTPWEVIARRLEAAGAADFVVALYNPASTRRRRPLEQAHAILARHRRGDTPVAVVTDAYREGQRTIVITLDHLLAAEIGMTTTVIVGSSRTFAFEGFLVTPRGYAEKYGRDGAGLAGEEAP